MDGELWKFEEFGVDAPLPDNYPPPTPIGCVEIKTYPSDRVALLDSRDLWFRYLFRLERSFWNLFNHISRKNLRFLCPVIMTYYVEPVHQTSEFKMIFIYRRKDIGTPGDEDFPVRVIDRPPTTVLSLGFTLENFCQKEQPEKEAILKNIMTTLVPEAWELVPGGEPRILNYNGPYVKPKWAEI